MHILIIPSWYVNTYNSISGIFFKEQAEALAKYNNKVGVIAIQEIGIKVMFHKKKFDIVNKMFVENNVLTYNIQYPAVPKLLKLRRKIRQVIFKYIFHKYIKKNGLPNIVHLHSFSYGEFAIWIKDTYHIPYVVTEHSTGFARNLISPIDMNRAKKIFRESLFNLAVSREFAKLLKEKTNIGFYYLPNIVNVNFFNIKINRTDNDFNFVNIAFLDKKKNQAMLIHAFHKIFKHKIHVKLTIAGDGPEYMNLKQLINILDMNNQIILYGRADRNEVKELLQNSDAFVLSSQYETFGVVLIEAMACGLPVISTKCGGPESIIIDEKLGVLVDTNVNSLTDGMKHIYETVYNKREIREYVVKNFSEKIIADKLINIYKMVLNES